MKVIGFNGSPRKNGNTQTLMEAVLRGAAGKGAKTSLINLCELDIKGCIGCEACKEDLGNCFQEDDLKPLLQEIKESDAIVLGTPVYWYHVTAQFKILVDRLYCFFDFEDDPKTGKTEEISAFPPGKKIVIVTSRGDEENTKTLPQLYQYLDEWLGVVGESISPSYMQIINHYGSFDELDSARNDSELMARAESAGSSLV